MQFKREAGGARGAILIQVPFQTQRWLLIAIPFQKKQAIPKTDSSITPPAAVKIKYILFGFYQDVSDESDRNVFLLNWNPGGLQIPKRQPHISEIKSKTRNKQDNTNCTGKKG